MKNQHKRTASMAWTQVFLTRVALRSAGRSHRLLAIVLATLTGGAPALAADDTAHPATGAWLATGRSAVATERVRRADFGTEAASAEARQVADWVVDSGDNQAMPFAVVDKKNARVYVWDAGGHLRGVASALLGLAVGDDAVPGIGDRPLSGIRPEERTTPAGRFVASLDRNLRGGDILWVDYQGAVSLHPVVTGTPLERRAQRLTSPTPLDNRISYGCINVPVAFFSKVVKPVFTGTNGVVYVLPEIRTARQVFASYDVDARARDLSVRQASSSQPAPPTAISDPAR